VRNAGAKLICHFHDGNDEQLVKTSFQHFEPDASIFVSEYLRCFWLSCLRCLANTYVVHNGADEDALYPVSASEARNQTPVVLYVGRLHPEKGPHVLLEAMRILHARRVRAKCRIVGSSYSGGSEPTPYVNRLLRSRPINVEFEGFCSAKNIGALYRSADILCCPSIWQEPFGKVNIEAMASGIPVVASRVGGIPEIAANGGVVMVTPGAPVELADALQELIEKKSLRNSLGAKGLQSFRENFTWRAVLKNYQMITDAFKEPRTAVLI
jgi:spore coat protein SA